MNKPRSRFRDLPVRKVRARISWAVLVVFAVAVALAWWFLPPPLPKSLRLGTGPADGFYTRFGEALRTEVQQHGIALELVSTAGSRENIDLLLSGEIDVGLVQSGNLSDAEAAELMSVASVSYELVLVVNRADWESDHIEGGRIAIGVSGSGSNVLARDLLEDQGVREGEPPGTEYVELGGAQAVEALLAGEIDSGVFVTSLDPPWLHTLFADPNLRVTHFELAEAFARHYRYLQRLVIPAGLIDLRTEIPPQDVQVIATTASLVTRPDFPRALIPLLVEGAREQLLQGSLLAAPGQFPSPHGVEAPISEDALHYFERGPSFFYRWLPFDYAHTATRLVVILLPLLTLLYPLVRSVGPTYRWVNQRRVYRWYRVLRKIEEKIDTCADATDLARIEKELDVVDNEIRGTHVPSRFGANLFALRAHQRLLVERLEKLKSAWQVHRHVVNQRDPSAYTERVPSVPGGGGI